MSLGASSGPGAGPSASPAGVAGTCFFLAAVVLAVLLFLSFMDRLRNERPEAFERAHKMADTATAASDPSSCGM